MNALSRAAWQVDDGRQCRWERVGRGSTGFAGRRGSLGAPGQSVEGRLVAVDRGPRGSVGRLDLAGSRPCDSHLNRQHSLGYARSRLAKAQIEAPHRSGRHLGKHRLKLIGGRLGWRCRAQNATNDPRRRDRAETRIRGVAHPGRGTPAVVQRGPRDCPSAELGRSPLGPSQPHPGGCRWCCRGGCGSLPVRPGHRPARRGHSPLGHVRYAPSGRP
jgi:hypothetical protein